MKEEELNRKGYMIDNVVAMDLPLRKVVQKLYEAAVANVHKPLCLAAAEKILEKTQKGDTIFIITGFPVLPKNVCETDGPPGAAVLAETLNSIGMKSTIVTDDLCIDVVKAVTPKISILKYPVENKTAKEMAEELFSHYTPSVLVSIERPGWNEKQEYHTMHGVNISNLVGKTDYLFSYAKKRGATTIAVGDGGNELGCGSIIETVRKHVPHGAKCQCPCGKGIAATTPSDVLVIGGTSNWGAYGIAACLSLLKNLEYSHDGKSESRLLDHIINVGGVDSVTGETQPFVDGVSTAINKLVVDLIWAITNA
jgi:hypothetical protein